ncbi:Bcr/CflA family multidrug efflux MFS transporter [Glaciimonas immobilis]|uniref:Bcr/CflA family efflux transporter n=1 Tax=Glaciimonas immobilis TaxID=728004 RepID=A0A840RPK1_9BURK|nr:Bcr/CflA family multidrug efflux MFS transporter [Glaciimonas immobilis]KAF3996805.1 Bcr/CflA family multidrug efflux MFS transporter [Glaciimonas immobilis]MBB5199653.1 DHA1 family bicyclomycin/chloramphenicol resistance-like MFS transporter [Glaciimonas immobilis]
MANNNDPTAQEKLLPGWLILLGALTAIGSLSIDMYLPSFPTIAKDLAVGSNLVQLTLASFLVGLAVGQIFYGPLSDHFGRKPPLYFGLGLYTLASLACLFAPNVTMLIIGRFMQGLGGCAGMVVGRAVIRDRMGAAGSAKAFSLLMLVMGISPILAPLIGGMVLKLWGWRVIFAGLTCFGLLCLIMIHTTMQETLVRKESTPLHLGRILKQYGALLVDRQFLAYALCGGLLQGGMFAYISGSPFVLIELHGIKPENFGWVFGVNAVGLIGASQVNARLVGKHTPDKILGRALWLPAGLTLVIALLVAAGVNNLPLLLIGFFGFLACYGFISPNASAIALAHQGHQAGTASALMGTLQFSLGIMSGVSMSLWHDGTALPLMTVMAICALGALLLHRIIASPEYHRLLKSGAKS